MAAQCEMIIGFLVPHRCPTRALAPCLKCNRHFCDEHLDIMHGGLVCTACQQGLEQPVVISQAARTFDDADILVFSSFEDFDEESDTIFSDLS